MALASDTIYSEWHAARKTGFVETLIRDAAILGRSGIFTCGDGVWFSHLGDCPAPYGLLLGVGYGERKIGGRGQIRYVGYLAAGDVVYLLLRRYGECYCAFGCGRGLVLVACGRCDRS